MAFSFLFFEVLLVEDQQIVVKGKNGELSMPLSKNIAVEVKDGVVHVSRANEEKATKAAHGMIRAMINNMVTGVTEGFTKTLEIEGVGYRAALKGEPVKRIRRRVDEACEMCKVSEFLRSPIGSLSAGLKKRVALADALLLRPRVLLLDDFLAGLDSDMRETAGAVLSNAAAFSSVIATGHELDDLAKWATRFFILRDGVVSASVSAVGVDRSSLRGRIAAALKGSVS